MFDFCYARKVMEEWKTMEEMIQITIEDQGNPGPLRLNRNKLLLLLLPTKIQLEVNYSVKIS